MSSLIFVYQRVRRSIYIPLAVFVFFCVLLASTYLDPGAAVRRLASGHRSGPATEANHLLGDLIEALYRPYVHPITAENFTDETGEVFRTTGEPFYKKSLGRRVLILDADTRPFTNDGELLSESGVKWPHPDAMSSGMLSHYLYSRIHGYDYQLLRVAPVADWSHTWSKVPAIKHALLSHDLVVFLDQDAVFRYPALPLEWLLNHWQHDAATCLLLAADPDKPFNTDPDGARYLNTGFVVAQNSTRTHDLLDAWLRCPTGEEFEGCRRFAYEWPHEQAALVSFVGRYQFAREGDVRAVPCAEANGSPWTKEEHGCRGALVRHLWMEGKGRQVEELADGVLRYVMPALSGDFRVRHAEALAEEMARAGVRDRRRESFTGDRAVAPIAK